VRIPLLSEEADLGVSDRGPWLSVVEAARYAGWQCANGRAPESFYRLARRIGFKLHGKWRIHRDDLDAHIRRCGGAF
jgi:hypothetical protein